MLEKEQRIKDQRLLEATKKDYLGIEGKFGRILNNLGESILATTEDPSNELEDVWALEEEIEIPTADPDVSVMEVGIFYDGLRSGNHLEIKYIHEDKRLSVYYKGYPVFLEIENDLEMFIPSPLWENEIEKLYTKTKALEKEKKIARNKNTLKEMENNKKKFLREMLRKWGFK